VWLVAQALLPRWWTRQWVRARLLISSFGESTHSQQDLGSVADFLDAIAREVHSGYSLTLAFVQTAERFPHHAWWTEPIATQCIRGHSLANAIADTTPNNWTSDIGYSSVLEQVNITFNQVVTQNYTYTITNTSTGCAVQDLFQVVVNPLPNATVIADTAICAGDSIAIGANSVVGSTYSWSSIPAGYVSTSSNPIPGVSPAVTTTYILEETVTATGCKKSNPVTITVQPIPVITIVGAPQIHICETTSQVQINATATNNTTTVWSTLIGSGSFNNNTILNPIYSPSLADINNGSVTLQSTVTGINPCTTTYTETLEIIIDIF
jgi:hypothetical protein